MKIKQIYQTVAKYAERVAKVIEYLTTPEEILCPDTYENRKRGDLGLPRIPNHIEREDLWLYQGGLENKIGE